MRGKAADLRQLFQISGITPAYAGKSKTKHSLTHPTRDHPRVCGEKGAAPCQRFIVLGSPPRMRGKAIDIGPIHGELGITPAYAGKSAVAIIR